MRRNNKQQNIKSWKITKGTFFFIAFMHLCLNWGRRSKTFFPYYRSPNFLKYNPTKIDDDLRMYNTESLFLGFLMLIDINRAVR